MIIESMNYKIFEVGRGFRNYFIIKEVKFYRVEVICLNFIRWLGVELKL